MAVELGEIINAKRSSKGWTQEELAENLYVTRQTVSRWERGHSYPTLDTLIKLSQILDFSLDYALLGDEGMVSKVAKDQKKALRNKRLLLCVAMFLVLSIAWGAVNYFQLNYRFTPARQIYHVEVVDDKVLVSVDNPNFWDSQTIMIDEGKPGELVLEVNQQFRFTNIFKNESRDFIVYVEPDALKNIESIRVKGSSKVFSISD